MSPKFAATRTPAHSPQKVGTNDAPPTPRANYVDGSCNVTLVHSEIAEANDKEFVSCTIEEFQSHYLRFLPTHVDVDRCIDALAQEGIGLFSTDNRTAGDDRAFTVFKRRGGPNEDLTFAPLIPISSVIGRQTFENRVFNGFKLKSCPNTCLKSDIEGGDYRIDACFWKEREYVEKNKARSSKTLEVSEIVIPMEFKQKGGQQDMIQNRRQILSVAHNMMQDDPRRSWIYGLTIEDNRVSLWYFSRSHCVKSQSFSFEKDQKRLVSVLISLQFATQQQLCYDECITRLSSGSFLYEIPQKDGAQSLYFKTARSIFEQRPLKMSGRMTRVWEVVQVTSKDDTSPLDQNASPMALKDVWLDSTADTEAEIQKNLFQDIRRFAQVPNWHLDPHLSSYDMLAIGSKPSETAQRQTVSLLQQHLEGDTFKDLFLVIVHHHARRPVKKVAEGAWDRRGLFEMLDIERVTKPGIATGSTRSRQLTQQHTTDPSISQAPQTEACRSEECRSFTPKHRCFFIHNQVCECLHDLSTLGDVVTVLRHTLIALRLMLLAGWVHRDISTGNILAFRSPGGLMGKLGDLEYAKRFPTSSTSPDFKTGTPYFMAAEIRCQRTFYRPPPAEIPAEQDFEPESNNDNQEDNKVKPPPLAFLIHNPQHDLESIWWVLLWFITSRVSHPQSSILASRYFQHSKTVATNRRDLLELGNEKFHKSYRPELIDAFSMPMQRIGEQLYAAYTKRGAEGLVENPEAYARIFNRFWNMFNFFDVRGDSWGHIIIPPLPSKSAPKDNRVSLQPSPRRSERSSTSASVSIIDHSSSEDSFDGCVGPRKRQRMDDN